MDNFDILLGRLREADEGMEDLTKDDFNELIGDLKGKIDGIKYFLSKCEAESKRLDKVIKEMERKKKAVQNSATSLKDWVSFTMYRHETPYLEGENYIVRLGEREKLTVNENIKLDSKSYLKYEGVIKREYKWNKTALKEAIKSGKFENVGTIGKTKFIKFNTKGVK